MGVKEKPKRNMICRIALLELCSELLPIKQQQRFMRNTPLLYAMTPTTLRLAQVPRRDPSSSPALFRPSH